jgi:monovalent cation:H+ antiporter, CPA1 family
VNVFDVAAILVASAALFGYVNHRLLHLPPTTGTLLVALVSSVAIVFAEQLVPGLDLRPAVERFLGEIDFDQTLMHGLLCFLLFAGALHVDLDGLIQHRYIIAGLATVGVMLSITVVGLLTWFTFGLIGVDVSLLACLTFGALISPTDPIAVMGCSRNSGRLRVSRHKLLENRSSTTASVSWPSWDSPRWRISGRARRTGASHQ